MMNNHIIKIRAYRALIRAHGRYLSKEIRKDGFKVSSDFSYGTAFKQLENFSTGRFEFYNDI